MVTKDGPALRLRGAYPLDPWLLPPVVWGGGELQRSWGKRAPAEAKLGESWEASCVPGRESVIAGSGATLAAAVAEAPSHFFGTAGGGPAAFPLLVKLLATSEFLSVQVHPDDAQALRLEESPHGKHEAWVVLDAAPGAEVLAGLAPGASAASLFEAAASGDSDRVRAQLARVPVIAGDVVEVPPGCVHAPGPGLVLYEVQQPVDLTYRIFDWGRARALHAAKAREVLDPAARPRVLRGAVGASGRERLAETRAFAIERVRPAGGLDVAGGILLIVTCTRGRGTLSAGADHVALGRGRSCVVPAATPSFRVDGEDLEVLLASRP